MAEEVKVVIKEELQGNAAAAEEARLRRLAQLQKTIAPAQQKATSLYGAAAAYEAKGMTDAAKSARADAAGWEKQIARASAEHAAAEKIISQEQKAQAALAKAGGHGHGGAGSSRVVGDLLDMATGQQGWVMRAQMAKNLPHIIEALLGSPALLAGGLLGAAAAGGLFYVGQKEQDAGLQNKLNSEGAIADFSRRRQMGIFGSSSGLVAESLNAQQEIAAREAQRAELERQAKYSLLGGLDAILGTSLATKGIGFFKPAGARAIAENEGEIARLKKSQQADQEAAYQKFISEDGGLDLGIARDLGQHTAKGAKDARTKQFTKTWLDEYQRIFHEAGETPAAAAAATESADLKTKQGERDWQTGIGSALVSARSGSRDIAAAARIASGGLDTGAIKQSIDAMHQTVNRNNGQQIEAATRRDFSPAPQTISGYERFAGFNTL